MALQTLNFTFAGATSYRMTQDFSHTGVVGSGDLEVLLQPGFAQDGQVTMTVVTPVTGFDHIWEKVLSRFVTESGVGNLDIAINDNNATPFVVATRLKQAIIELEEGVSP